MLLVASGAQGIGFGFFGPSRVAFTAELVGRKQLGNAISLSLLSMNGTRIFAPAMAGVLVGVHSIGIGGGYLLSASLAIVSLFVLFKLSEVPVAGVEERRNPFVEIIDGIRYVKSIPSLRRLVLCSFFVIMFAFSHVVFVPALVEGVYGLSESWVGLFSSASAVGAVAVSIPLAARADSPLAKVAMVLFGIGFGLTVLLLGLAPEFWSAFVVGVLIGGASTGFQTLANTLALGLADDAHQGRVQSLFQLSFAGFGIAAFPLGALAETIGLQNTIMVMGGIAIAAVVIFNLAEKRDTQRLAGGLVSPDQDGPVQVLVN
jgi:MFS family permease